MELLLLTPLQVRRIYGIHPNTLLRWEREGRLKPIRTSGGRRRYRRGDNLALLGLEEAQQAAPQVAL